MWDSLPTIVQWAIYIVAFIIVASAALLILRIAGVILAELFSGLFEALAELWKGLLKLFTPSTYKIVLNALVDFFSLSTDARAKRREAKRRRSLGYDK